MKTFKHFLNENRPPNKEWNYMLDAYMPIKPGFFKDFKNQKKQTVYRVAGYKSPKNIKKYENKKGMFSGFTKSSDGVAQGIYSGATYLWVVEANIEFESNYDMYIQTDRNGFKWLNNSTFSNYMYKEMKKYFNNLGIYNNRGNMLVYLDGESIDSKTSGKRKKDFIAWYYDTAKQIIKTHKKVLLKSIEDTLYASLDNTYLNNELIFNEYKVKEVYIISNINKNIWDDYKKSPVLAYNHDYRKDEYNELVKVGFKDKFKGFILNTDVAGINEKNPPSKYAFKPKESLQKIWDYLSKNL